MSIRWHERIQFVKFSFADEYSLLLLHLRSVDTQFEPQYVVCGVVSVYSEYVNSVDKSNVLDISILWIHSNYSMCGWGSKTLRGNKNLACLPIEVTTLT